MNRAIIMKDRRLIEALDYIDDEYIASAALYKMRAYAESTRPLAQTPGQSVKKHWKHYLGFVACILVLALATPLFTHLPEIINSFAAGWGEGTENIDSTDIPTDGETINETDALYFQYTPELEHLTPAQIEKINNDYFEFYHRMTKEAYIESKAGGDESRREWAKYYVETFSFIPKTKLGGVYYGVFGESVVVARMGNLTDEMGATTVAGYSWHYPYATEIYVYTNGDFCNIHQAYENGLLDDKDIKTIFERHCRWEEYIQ